MSAAESIRQVYVGREVSNGTLSPYLYGYPCLDFKPAPKDTRYVPNEYMGTRIRQRKATRVKKYSDISFKVHAYYDLTGWLLNSIVNAPVSSTLRASNPTPASNVQTLTFVGSWATADTFTLTVNGYQTAAIAYNTTAATTVTNIQNAINALPSVVKTANLTVAGTGPFTLTAGGNLVSCDLPLVVGSVVSTVASGTSITVANTTPGVGVYDHVWKGGTSALPTLSIVYFDGVSYKAYVGCGIDSMDFTFTVDKDVEIDVKAVGKMETDQGTLYQATVNAQPVAGTVNTTIAATITGSTTAQVVTPASMTGIGVGTHLYIVNAAGTNGETVVVTAVTGTTFTAVILQNKAGASVVQSPQVPLILPVIAAYAQPIDPTQLALTVGGTADNTLLSGKISMKGNRKPLHTIGNLTDMQRATEGMFEVTFDLQFDYQAYANSYYQKWINNSALGSIVITATDTTTTLNASPVVNPVMKWTLPLPQITDGIIDSSKDAPVVQCKGTSMLDPTTNTNVRFDITNEEPRFSVLN